MTVNSAVNAWPLHRAPNGGDGSGGASIALRIPIYSTLFTKPVSSLILIFSLN